MRHHYPLSSPLPPLVPLVLIYPLLAFNSLYPHKLRSLHRDVTCYTCFSPCITFFLPLCVNFLCLSSFFLSWQCVLESVLLAGGFSVNSL